MSALRLHLPGRPVEHIDLGPLAHVRPPGHAYVYGRPVFGQSGDGEHKVRDWAAIKKAQRARGVPR